MNQHNLEIEKKICALEEQQLKVQKDLEELHAQMEGEEVTGYEFEGPNGTLTLNEMFDDKDEMIMVHNMGKGCSYCSLWADGFNGFTEQLETRAAFVLTSPDDFKTLSAHAESRGWRFKTYSTNGVQFQKDMGFYRESDEGTYALPGLSFFYKEGDKVYRKTRTNLGPGDLYCSVWHMFSRLNKGVNNWQPIN